MLVKCGKKGFAPKSVVAQCEVARNLQDLLFDEFEFGPSQDKTKCFNTIYEKYSISPEDIHGLYRNTLKYTIYCSIFS